MIPSPVGPRQGEESLATFVLIHGAWHGGWCWELMVPLLTAYGHHVHAPDLPGMGADQTAFADDVIGQWTDAMVDLVETQLEPVVLVGHSRGGLLVSTVAERVPDRVCMGVYLTACLLCDGQALADVEMASEDLLAAVNQNGATDTATVNPECARRLLYDKCAPDTAQKAITRLVAEPLQPVRVPLHVTDRRFGRVPRAFIEATEDRAVLLRAQREMQARWPCDLVVAVPSDHSPFYSMPERLAEILDELPRGRSSNA
jgi:pimeloyl-ACP methyl ester carboxylesterase